MAGFVKQPKWNFPLGFLERSTNFGFVKPATALVEGVGWQLSRTTAATSDVIARVLAREQGGGSRPSVYSLYPTAVLRWPPRTPQLGYGPAILRTRVEGVVRRRDPREPLQARR